jgi:hypothetical protein
MNDRWDFTEVGYTGTLALQSHFRICAFIAFVARNGVLAASTLSLEYAALRLYR